MNFIIIHGAYGNPEENWFPWLKEELEKQGHNVIVPSFPTPEGQELDNWLNVFEEHKQNLNQNTIMIGHSIGPAFILRLLERIDSPIKAAFLVSAWIGNTGSEKFDPINKTFTTGDFNWEKIKQNCKTFYMFNSNNDPYVPFERTKELANKLDIKITIVKDGNHINEAAGFVEFPQLLESIKKEVGL